MEERRSYSVVDSPIQLRFMAILLGIVMVMIVVGGAYVWSLVDTLSEVHSIHGSSAQAWLDQLYFRGYIALFTIGITVFIGLFLVIRATHRIVGPLYRLKRELEEMRESEELHMVTIRDPDQIHDFVLELNQLLKEVDFDGETDTANPPQQKGDTD